MEESKRLSQPFPGIRNSDYRKWVSYPSMMEKSSTLGKTNLFNRPRQLPCAAQGQDSPDPFLNLHQLQGRKFLWGFTLEPEQRH